MYNLLVKKSFQLNQLDILTCNQKHIQHFKFKFNLQLNPNLIVMLIKNLFIQKQNCFNTTPELVLLKCMHEHGYKAFFSSIKNLH